MSVGNVVFFSPFVPEEWIAAHGLQPQRMEKIPPVAQQNTAVRGMCPYAGAMIEHIESMFTSTNSPKGPGPQAVVLTTICDQVRYANAFIGESLAMPTFLMNVPSIWQTPAAKWLYRDELVRLGRFLIELGGKAPSTEMLLSTMQTYDSARRVKWEKNSGNNGNGSPRGVPLALVGGPLPAGDDDIVALVSRAGGQIVLDASEHGERTRPAPFERSCVSEDPIGMLVEAYFGSIPDVFRRPNAKLYEWLAARLSERKVRGIIYCRYMFCDLWHAELHRMRSWSPVPILDIDITHGDDSRPARMLGRIESFLEVLQ